MNSNNLEEGKELEGLEKEFFQSKAIPSPRRSITGENNENDSNREQVNSNSKFHSHKKVVVKHFMSPTISAASKAAAPRNKILAERIENSSTSDDENKKHSSIDTKRGSINTGTNHSDRSSSRVVSSYRRAYESDEEGDVNSTNDSSVKAYDPLTNYLSPRPKYLRFDPNKRREILNRIEKEEKQLNNYSDSQEGKDEEESSVEELKEIIKQENDENSKDDCDDEEDEVEDRGWCLRGVLKVMLTLIACLLSTSYICSMNSPTTSPTQQAFSNFKDNYLMIKEQTLEVITMKMREAGFFKVEVGDIYIEVAEIETDNGDGYEENEENIKPEIVDDYEANLDGNKNDDVAEFKAESFEELLVEKIDGSGGFCLEKELDHSFDDLHEDNTDMTKAEIVWGDEKSDEIIGSHEKFTDSSHEVEEKENDSDGETEKVGWNNSTLAIIGVSIVSIILTSLAFIHHSKKTRTLAKKSRPVLKAHKKVFPKKKIEFSARPEVLDCRVDSLHDKNIEFSARPEELNRHVGAPSVELIGEIVVGQMSSLKITSTPTKLSEHEHSTPSYGSFTTTEKVLKKEGGRSGEPVIEVTPVRRSTRIRNRAMSP